MHQNGTILAAVDFSPCSAAALREAVRIAAWKNSTLRAIHVVDIAPDLSLAEQFTPVGLPLPSVLDEALAQRARHRWPAFLTAAGGRPGAPLTVEIGIPRDRILEAVKRDKPALLVMGAHGAADAARQVGPTAAACAQRAAARVMLVRERQAGPFRSVLACVDFSDVAGQVLDDAVSIAAQDNAALHVIHVYTDPWRGAGPPAEIARNMPDFAARYRAAVEDRVRALAEPLAHELGALRPEYHALQADRHADGTIAYARERGCDLAILGTRGRWTMRDFFWGSTAERVVRECPCSVLAVKPPGFDGRAPYARFADAEALATRGA